MLFLVFGEDVNDCQATAELIKCICNTPIQVRVVPKPPILTTAADRKKRLRNADRVVDAITLFSRKMKNCPIVVVLHQDADAVEPGHRSIAASIEKDLKERASGVAVDIIAAVPAWEMEAWLLLFPDAIALRRKCWKRIAYTGHTGSITNAKEYLRRSTRTKGRACPDYRESDAPEIAKLIDRTVDLSEARKRSASFSLFADKILRIIRAAGE